MTENPEIFTLCGSTSQILRESNIGIQKSVKSAILIDLETLTFDFDDFFALFVA